MKALTTYAVTGVLVAVVVMTMGVRPGAQSRGALTVRFYNTSGIPASELSAARSALEQTFRDAGLDLNFRQCGRPVFHEDAIDPCGEPLKPLEVVVRVIDAPAFNQDLHPEACGMAYLVKETDRGWLATVFSDRIGSAAARVGVEPGRLLGLVAAHEVAHLLLGIGYHGETGVMRADWPDALLTRTAEQWRFSTLEAARLRQAASIPF